MRIAAKRAYTEPAPGDGFRILIDRLWPRGIGKEKARIDLWLKDVAPSTELRKWFGHDPAKWPGFQRRYREELGQKQEALQDGNPAELWEARGEELWQKQEQLATIKAQATKTPVTLVYGAKDEEHNDAVVLLQLLKR